MFSYILFMRIMKYVCSLIDQLTGVHFLSVYTKSIRSYSEGEITFYLILSINYSLKLSDDINPKSH